MRAGRSPSEWRDAFGYLCSVCGYDRWGEPRSRWRQYKICLGCVLAIRDETPLRYKSEWAAADSLSDGERAELRADLDRERTGHLTAEVFARKEMAEKPGPEDALGVLWPYVDGQYVPDVPTGWVEPWEQNPRKTFEDAALRELAESIRADGVQQPIVCRLTETIGTGSLRRPVLQIVMGERRWRASCLAERPTLPVIVRVGLSDRDALRLAVAENLKRRDLNAMEEADSYRALLDAGYSQVEIAAQVGIAESTISNALRLRKHPASIRDMVTEGKLTGSHARALLRFEGYEAVQVRIAELAIEEGVSAKSLEKGVPFYNTLVNEKLAGYPGYDFRAVCETCPFNAYRKYDHRGICLNPPHIVVLEEAQKADQEARARVALEEMERKKRELLEATRKQQEAARSKAGQDVVALLEGQAQKEESKADVTTEQAGVCTGNEVGSAGAEKVATGGEAVSSVEAAPVSESSVSGVSAPALEPPDTSAPAELFVGDLPYNSYATISNDSAAACRADCSDCPCKAEARYNAASVGKTAICLDPKRYASLKAQQTRAAQKERKQAFGDTAERLFGLQVSPDDRRALALMLWKQFEYLPQTVIQKLLPEIAGTSLADLLPQTRYGRKEVDCWEALAALPVEQMLTLALRAPLLYELHTAIALKSDNIPMNRWYFGDAATSPAPEVPVPDDSESEDTERVTTCAECGKPIADEDLHTPVVEYGKDGQFLESGVFLLPMQESDVDYEPGGFVCATCAADTDMAIGAVLAEAATAHAYKPGDVVEVNTGSLTNGGANWTRAIVHENVFPETDLRHDLIATKLGEPGADTPTTYRHARYVRPVSSSADDFEDPACRTCGDRRAQVGGLCWVCFNAEAADREKAVCNL